MKILVLRRVRESTQRIVVCRGRHIPVDRCLRCPHYRGMVHHPIEYVRCTLGNKTILTKRRRAVTCPLVKSKYSNPSRCRKCEFYRGTIEILGDTYIKCMTIKNRVRRLA